MRIKNQNVLPRVLYALGNAAIAISSATPRHAGSVYRAFRKFRELQKVSDEQLRQTTRYAVDKKYIEVFHRSGKRFLRLTKDGKRLVGRAAISALRLSTPSTWDRKWRVVMFDIPEIRKKSRDSFAADLKRIGLLQVQKSVFAYPYLCFEELEILTDFHDVSTFTTCMVVGFIKPDRELRSYLNYQCNV